MSAVAESNVPCSGATCTIDAATQGTVTKGGYKLSQATDDTTVNGFYRDCGTTKKATGTITVAWPAGGTGAPPVVYGEIHPLIINSGAALPYLSCNARFHEVNFNGLDKEAALLAVYSWTSQGDITTVNPG